MSYAGERREDRVVEPAVVNPVVDYHDFVRWGPIVAGLVVAIATQLVLSALAAGFGLSNILDPTAVGIWTIVNLFVSLLIGGWVMARSCGPMNNKTALLNGAILWGASLAVSVWLVANGVTGTFGVAIAAGAGALATQTPGNLGATGNLSQQEIQQLSEQAAQTAWGFVIGSLIGLASALIGATVGARRRARQGQ